MKRSFTSVLTVFLVMTAAPEGARAAEEPARVFIGGASRGSNEDSPWSIYARFGTCGPAPADGSWITIVPRDPSLPTIAARIESTLQIGLINGRSGHDYGCFAFTSVISSMQWRDRLPSSIDKPWYQPVVVVLGTWPKAHIQSPGPTELRESPGKRRKEDVVCLIDVDGDNRTDIGVWSGCNGPATDCLPNVCQEVWSKKRAKWHMLERTCAR